MYNHIIPYYINLALEQVMKEQKKLLSLKNFSKETKTYLPLIQNLSELAIELQDWLLGKLDKKSPIDYFHKKALKLEKKADKVSIKLWHANMLSVSSVFDYAKKEKTRLDNDLGMMFRTHYDIQRMRLLEQIKGAKLLQNNNDLGDEVEKIFLQYLEENLDNDCRVVRGGHIFDENNNRSSQMDIIVIPSKSLSMCPSATQDGKFNVMIDQVIAAFSVKSTLNKKSFEGAWNDIQSIPIFKDKEINYPSIKDSRHSWPLCFIISGNSIQLNLLNNKWEELIDKGQIHQLQLFLSLDRGYSIAGNSSWPLINFSEEYKGSFRADDGLQAGVGLGWILATISARSAVLSNRPLKQFSKIHKLLSDATMKTGCGSPSFSLKNYNQHRGMGIPIKDCKNIRWGNQTGMHLHNNLFVCPLIINEKRLINKQISLSEKDSIYWDKEPFESRWFEIRSQKLQKNILTLKEWSKEKDGSYSSKILSFNCLTGEEIEK